MKYAALLTNHADAVTAWEAMSPEEAAAARAEEVPQWEALFGELGASGALGAGYELDSPKTARTVRVRDGETLVTDGPFADTKEQIGGLMEIEAEDLDAAIAIAARIPVVFRAVRRAEAGHRALTTDVGLRFQGGMGPCRCSAHPRPRRHPARRGRGAGRLHDRARALAPRRHAGEPRRLDHHRGPEPGDRPAPPRADLRPQGRAARAARGAAGRGRRRELDPRRPARPRLHLLPPRAGRGVARRADAARGRRPDHDRDRARVPRRGAGDGPAPRAGEEEGPRRRHPLPRPARPPAAGAAAVRARGALPRLQRGLLRQRRRRTDPGRALRRGDQAVEAARGADAGRAGGARAAGADAPARRAPRGPPRPRRRDRPSRRSGSQPLEPAADRRRLAPARARAVAPASRRLPGAGGDRCAPPRGTESTGRRSRRSTPSWRGSSPHRSSS